MTVEFSLLQAAVTVGFGALAGGVTNAVAIWMLFHPYEPHRLGWMKFQGALPKNKPRLARTIGRTVGQRLLTSEDLVRQLRAPEMRAAFNNAIRSLLSALLDTERDSVRRVLPPAAERELETLAARVAEAVGDHAARFAADPEFRGTAARFLERLREDVAERPLGDVLTEARRAAIRRRVEGWVADAAQSDDLVVTLSEWLDRQVARMAADRTPLLERLPPELVAAVERAIAGYLPVAIDHLASTLRDPAARARVERALHQLFERFAQDLLIHQRIVAKLVVTERTFTRLLDTFEHEGADELARLLEEPAMRTQIAQAINDAMVAFLERPLAEHCERLGPTRLAGIKTALRDQLVTALRDPATQAFAIERLDRALQSAERRTWGELLRHLDTDDAAGWLANAAQAPRMREWVTDAARNALTSLLDRPLGRPADWLGSDGAERLATTLTPALWRWIEDQLPRVAQRVDVEAMVEEKVLGFSLQRMEEIVRGATERELRLIVRIGYVLGGLVGALAYGVALML